MDTSTMAIAMNAMTVANQSTNLYGNTAADTDMSFSQLLSSLTGTGLAGQTDANALLSGMGGLNGLSGTGSWQDIQNSMMLELLGSMQKAEQNPTVTDPALAGLLQLLKGMSGEASEENTADMLRIVEQMQQRLAKMLDEEGVLMGSQQAMALMGSIVPQMAGLDMTAETLDVLTQADGGATLEMMLNSTPEQLLGTMTGNAAGGNHQVAQAEAYAEQVAPATETQTAQADSEAGQAQQAKAQTGPVEVLQYHSGAASEAQNKFASAVQAVKQQMAQGESDAQTAAGAKKELDIDELQGQVNAGTFLQNTAFAQNLQAARETTTGMTAQPVPQQLQDAVMTGIQNGADEVIVKLNPEELGEVTIKLHKTDEGMRLDIIAKNPETQRLLAGELGTLQDGLKDMKVEVDSIITQRQYELLNGQGQFGGQHQRSWKEMHGAAYYGDEPLAGGEEQDPQPVMVAAPNTVLDAYI